MPSVKKIKSYHSHPETKPLMSIVGELKDSCNPRDIKASHYTGHRNRLRKRIALGGSTSVLDYEILELLLFSTHSRQDMKPLVKSIIKNCGGFHRVFSADANQLRQIKGVSESVVATIKAVSFAMQKILKASFEKNQYSIIGPRYLTT